MGSNTSNLLKSEKGDIEVDSNLFSFGSNRNAYNAKGVSGILKNKKFVAKIPKNRKIIKVFHT